MPTLKLIEHSAATSIAPPCVECRHMQRSGMFYMGMCYGCKIPDIVHGHLYATAREQRAPSGMCGIEGRRFEPLRRWNLYDNDALRQIVIFIAVFALMAIPFYVVLF